MKFQFSYPRRKPHWLCHGKRQKAPTPEPQWGTGWHRRLGNCLPNEDLSLPSLQIILSLAGMVRRDSSRMPHFPSSCKMLITCFQLQPRLSSWKSQAFLWKEGSALSLCFDMWCGASSDSGTKWEVCTTSLWKNREAREPLSPYLTHCLAETSLIASSWLPRCQHRWFGCTFLISNEGPNCPRV